jgi:hypothetical protein
LFLRRGEAAILRSWQHVFHLLVIVVVVNGLGSSFLGLCTALVAVSITQTVMVGESAALVEDSNLLKYLTQVLVGLLELLSQSLHGPILILPETLENKIQKLVLRNTGGLENLALLWLGCRCSVFLGCLSVWLELELKSKKETYDEAATPVDCAHASRGDNG